VVLHNTLIDASDSYPEPFTVKLIPVRASPLTFTVPSGEETTITVELRSFALSGASVIPLSVSGDAQISSITETLGYGFTHEVEITLTATTPSTIILGIALERADQFNIGFTFFGEEITVLQAKGFALVVIEVVPED
jgi:drug/metabolite transporter (DMT)-like permease